MNYFYKKYWTIDIITNIPQNIIIMFTIIYVLNDFKVWATITLRVLLLTTFVLFALNRERQRRFCV